MTEEHFNALPAGYDLLEYEIKSVLGHGGFGITYLAWDKNLEKEVAIKEYLPAEFAVRRGERTVKPRSTGDQEDYEWGLERFVKEAQTLALFRHASIVPVFRFFEANGTAYMVMEYQKGEPLSGLMRKHRGEFTEDDLLSLAIPLLDGLSAVHKAGYLHRDVKPGNIYIREDGSPVLLDFGAARDAVGRKSQSLTSIVTPGYAPLEQYFADGNQGPWTDIYALAAILYQTVTGKIPPEAPARVKNDPMQPCAELAKGKFSTQFLAAIDGALTVEEERRPQTTDEWRDMLEGRIAAGAGIGEAAAAAEGGKTLFAGGARRPSAGGTPTMIPERSVEPEQKSKTGLFVGIGVAAFVIFFGAVAGAWYLTDEQGFNTALGITGAKQVAGKTEAERRAERRRQEEAERLKREEADGKRQADKAERKRQADEAERKRQADEAERKRQAELDRERKRKAGEADRRRREDEKRKRDARLDDRLGKDADREEAERRRKAEADRKARAEADAKARREAERKKQEAARKAKADRKARDDADAKARREAERKKREADRKAEADRKRRELASRTTVRCGSSLASLNPLYKSATDCIWVRRVRDTTLRQRNPGVTNRWRNSRTGNSGTFTVLRTYKKADGTYCRRYRQTVTSDGVTRRAIGTACRVNRRWQVGG